MSRIEFVLVYSIILGLTISSVDAQNFTFRENTIVYRVKNELTRNDAPTLAQINTLLENWAPISEHQQIGPKESKDFGIVEFASSVDVIALCNKLQQSDLFEYIEPDYIGTIGGQAVSQEPNDPFFSRQWSLSNVGYFEYATARLDADISMTEAWDITTGDENVIVAFLDTGLKLDHPEFEGRLWINEKEIPNNLQDDDKNGFPDDHEGGWDFVHSYPLPIDDHGHGTNVTGIFGASGNNEIGYAGIDWKSQIMVLKVIDENSYGGYSAWANAIYYATDNGADIINMSIGGVVNSSFLRDAVIYANKKGVTVIACSMNTNSDQIYYPAGFPEVIAVGSTNPDDERTSPFYWDPQSGSNYGQHLDIVAPGNYIFGLSYLDNNRYGNYWGGTSQAVPHVTGVASLLLAIDSTLTPDEIRTILRESADDQRGIFTEDTPGFDIYHGHGRLNAYRALSSLNTTIVEMENKNTFQIFPNPVDHFAEAVNLNFSSDLSVNEFSYQWFDNLGRQIGNVQQIQKSIIPLPNSLSSGQILFCHIFNDHFTSFESVLVK